MAQALVSLFGAQGRASEAAMRVAATNALATLTATLRGVPGGDAVGAAFQRLDAATRAAPAAHANRWALMYVANRTAVDASPAFDTRISWNSVTGSWPDILAHGLATREMWQRKFGVEYADIDAIVQFMAAHVTDSDADAALHAAFDRLVLALWQTCVGRGDWGTPEVFYWDNAATYKPPGETPTAPDIEAERVTNTTPPEVMRPMPVLYREYRQRAREFHRIRMEQYATLRAAAEEAYQRWQRGIRPPMRGQAPQRDRTEYPVLLRRVDALVNESFVAGIGGPREGPGDTARAWARILRATTQALWVWRQRIDAPNFREGLAVGAAERPMLQQYVPWLVQWIIDHTWAQAPWSDVVLNLLEGLAFAMWQMMTLRQDISLEYFRTQRDDAERMWHRPTQAPEELGRRNAEVPPYDFRRVQATDERHVVDEIERRALEEQQRLLEREAARRAEEMAFAPPQKRNVAAAGAGIVL